MDSAVGLKEFEARWQEALGAGYGMFKLVDARHPLKLYIGGNQRGEPTLSVVLAEQPPPVPSFDALEMERRRRSDGTWVLLFQLQSADAFDEYIAMCAALIAASQGAGSEAAALDDLLSCLNKWRRLFKPVRDGLLSVNQLQGLAAELVAMKQLLRPSRSWKEIIHGWVGPLQAPQDFRLADDLRLEVKSVHAGSKSIRISSLEQLTLAQSRFCLLTIQVDREVLSAPRVVTVPELCRSIYASIGMDFELVDTFQNLLGEVGFRADDPAYDDFHFRIGAARLYEVSAAFPRLETGTVPPGLLRAEYDLELSSMKDFEVDSSLWFPGTNGTVDS